MKIYEGRLTFDNWDAVMTARIKHRPTSEQIDWLESYPARYTQSSRGDLWFEDTEVAAMFMLKFCDHRD